MAIISKATIANALGIDSDNIPDSVYTWGIKQFFILTGLEEVETSYVYRKLIGTSTFYAQLRKNISTVDSITIDGTSVDITLNSNVKINEDSGLLYYTTGFGEGQKVVINYKVAQYTHRDIYDLLITMFVLKGMVMFTPQEVFALVRKVSIGKYSRTFGAVEGTLGAYLDSIDNELDKIKRMALGDDGQMGVGTVT